MKNHNCDVCKFRKRYDNNPKSLLGRIWRWHIGFCPGFKSYMLSLDNDKRVLLADKYDIAKFK